MSNPQILLDIPFEEYKKNPGVNASFLKKFAISPLYAKTDQFESSAATELGNYVHALLIDRSSLANFAVLPTTGEGSRKARDEWKKSNPNGILLSPSAMGVGKSCADAMIEYPPYKELVDLGFDSEVTLYASHPKYGFPMKARIDILHRGKTMILGDIKTYGKPFTKKSLFYDIRDRGYDLQLVHYRRMLQMVLNDSPSEMALYFVETETSAYDCVKVTLDEGWLALAEHKLDEYYRLYDECYRSDVYPPFNFGQPLNLTLGDKL